MKTEPAIAAPPLATFFKHLRRSITREKLLANPDLQRAFLTLSYAPKFSINDPDSILPPIEQANETVSPPLPYPTFLLTFTAVMENPAEEQLLTRIVFSLNEANDQTLLSVTIVGEKASRNVSFTLTRGNHLKDWTFTPVSELSELSSPVIAFVHARLCPYLIRFLALLAAENVEVVPPTGFSRKRELSRIKANKPLNTYTLHHLRIPQARKPSSSAPTGRTNRAHWRRAHLRHYVAGHGHIKTTKTIAIPPVFCSGEGFADKDYIL